MKTTASMILVVAWMGVCTVALPAVGQDVPIRTLTYVASDTSDAIVGIGLVNGLNGTGTKDPTTRLAYMNYLDSMGIPSEPIIREQGGTTLKTENMSFVTLTGQLTAAHQVGSRITVTVAAAGNTKSLLGGVLLPSILIGPDKEVYAVAEGKIQVGGFAAGGDAASIQQNVPTTGEVQARVVRAVPACEGESRDTLKLMLHEGNSTTAVRIVDAINSRIPGAAFALNDSTVNVQVPYPYQSDLTRFRSLVQDITIVPNVRARIVINEDTGTIIIGEAVRMSRVAVTHANLQIVAGENPQVSQPAPLSNGETVVVPQTDLTVSEEDRELRVLEQTTTVGDLVDALNSLGVTPRDLSSILRNMHQQGSLHAELEFR